MERSNRAMNCEVPAYFVTAQKRTQHWVCVAWYILISEPVCLIYTRRTLVFNRSVLHVCKCPSLQDLAMLCCILILNSGFIIQTYGQRLPLSPDSYLNFLAIFGDGILKVIGDAFQFLSIYFATYVTNKETNLGLIKTMFNSGLNFIVFLTGMCTHCSHDAN